VGTDTVAGLARPGAVCEVEEALDEGASVVALVLDELVEMPVRGASRGVTRLSRYPSWLQPGDMG
jgi:hypothetical protein